MGHLTGETTTPLATNPAYKMWEAKNFIVMAWLINSMELKIGRTYMFFNTAHEI